MTYASFEKGVFLSRPNRFIAHVSINGIDTVCHVKNTGRCKELLTPGATVILTPGNNPNRKTPYDLVAVYKENRLINMDSQAPNAVAAEWLKQRFPAEQLRAEIPFEDSRLDFLLTDGEKKRYVEVKGVTLESDGIVSFPDAPTVRGSKHLSHLIKVVEDGHRAAVLFIVQMEHVTAFTPHDDTDPLFGQMLRKAAKVGVEVWAVECHVTETELTASRVIPVRL